MMALPVGDATDDSNSLCYGGDFDLDRNMTVSGPRLHALTILGTVFMSLLSLLIIVGNGLIIISVTCVKQLRQPGNFLIVSLALSDFLVGFIVLPLTIVYDVGGEWVFGSMMCDVHVSFDVICCTASIIHICMISIDRYLIITRPLRYRQQRSGKLMACATAFAWLFSALIIIPALFGFTENVKDAPGWFELSASSILDERNSLCGRQQNSNATIRGEKHCAENALDRNLSTYWDPGKHPNDWYFTVDLKQVYNIERIGIESAVDHDISMFSIQTEICQQTIYQNLNQTFFPRNATSGRQVCEVAHQVAARVIRLTINEAANVSPRVLELFVYGEKLTGKTCLISQEVWFTIYSTLVAFYIPLTVMFIMYGKIYVEANRFNARYQGRSNSFAAPRSRCFSLKEANPLPSNAPSLVGLVPAPNSHLSFSWNGCEKNRKNSLKNSAENLKECEKCNGFDANPTVTPLLATGPVESCDSSKHGLCGQVCNGDYSFLGVEDNETEENLINSKDTETILHSCDDLCLNVKNKSEYFPFPNNKFTHRKFSVPNEHYSNVIKTDTSARSRTFPLNNKNNKTVNLNSYGNLLPTTNHHKPKPAYENGNTAVTRFPPISEEGVLEFYHKDKSFLKRRCGSCSTRSDPKRKYLQRRSCSEINGMDSKRFRCHKFSSSSSPSLSKFSRTKFPLQRSLSSPGGNMPSSKPCPVERKFKGLTRSISILSKFAQNNEEGFSFSNKKPNLGLFDSLRRRVSSSATSGDRKLNKKATRTLGVIIGAFTVCWLPFFIVTFIRPFVCENPDSQDCIPLTLVRVVLWLGYVNSALNPIIYIGFSPDLRETFRLLLSCKCTNVNRRIAQTELRQAISREKRLSVGGNLTRQSIL